MFCACVSGVSWQPVGARGTEDGSIRSDPFRHAQRPDLPQKATGSCKTRSVSAAHRPMSSDGNRRPLRVGLCFFSGRPFPPVRNFLPIHFLFSRPDIVRCTPVHCTSFVGSVLWFHSAPCRRSCPRSWRSRTNWCGDSLFLGSVVYHSPAARVNCIPLTRPGRLPDPFMCSCRS